MKVFIFIILAALLTACSFWGDVEQLLDASNCFKSWSCDEWEWILFQNDEFRVFKTATSRCSVKLNRDLPFWVLVRPYGLGTGFAGGGKNFADKKPLVCSARAGEVYSLIGSLIEQKNKPGTINHKRIMAECRKLDSKFNRALRKAELAKALHGQYLSSRSFKLVPSVPVELLLPSGTYKALNPVDESFIVDANTDSGNSAYSKRITLGLGIHRYVKDEQEVWILVDDVGANVIFR